MADYVRAVAHLRASLEEAADALAQAHLDRLLACEARLEGALLQLPTETLSPDLRAAIAAEVERSRAALTRCRRLGTALHDFIRLGLGAQGLTGDYSPRGRSVEPRFQTVSTTV